MATGQEIQDDGKTVGCAVSDQSLCDRDERDGDLDAY